MTTVKFSKSSKQFYPVYPADSVEVDTNEAPKLRDAIQRNIPYKIVDKQVILSFERKTLGSLVPRM